ncbi:MAG: hypothetical protein OEO77_04680 [Acidimicrobiia bacterium]|nr:hypothetical protein [Acidimicrobiia bacterium]
MYHPAASDCEQATAKFGQPINTFTSVGMAVIGIGLEQRARRQGSTARAGRWVGAALTAAGLGSAAYHGPGESGHWLHDVTLLAPAATLAIASEGDMRGHEHERTALLTLGTLAVLAAGRARGPHTQDFLSAVVGTALGAAIIRRIRGESDHRAAWLVAGGGAGVVAFALSRTDGPWCDPHSRLQGHGVWHVLVAAATVATAHGLGLVHPRTSVT